ncbi:MAG TPA: hypothetical protein VFQ53_13165 [Kofleriaceae bacterium]|nr:hypothetical protein [Kofleriaceae bacterium]
MRRLASAVFALALLAAIAVVIGLLVEDSEADLENQVFTSRADRLRMVVPRGWRATDQPSYPGLLLWMMRTQPPGQIVLTSEAFTRELYCSWPVPCRNQPTNTGKYVCAIREKLQAQRLRVGPVQPGPKETEAGGLPSVWFEYDDGRRYLRHAVAVTADRAVSLVLSAPTSDARAAHVRPFDQALRTLHLLTAAETVTIAPPDATAVATAPTDGGPADAMTLPTDGAVLDGGVAFQSAPTPRIDPIGPCR